MEIEYDSAKNQANIEARGLSFDQVADLDWENALEVADSRQNYGEPRIRAFVRDASGLAYSVTYTIRGDAVRVISFRRAHELERKHYV